MTTPQMTWTCGSLEQAQGRADRIQPKVTRSDFLADDWAYLDLSRATAYKASLDLAKTCMVVNEDFCRIIHDQMRTYAKQAVMAARRHAQRRPA